MERCDIFSVVPVADRGDGCTMYPGCDNVAMNVDAWVRMNDEQTRLGRYFDERRSHHHSDLPDHHHL